MTLNIDGRQSVEGSSTRGNGDDSRWPALPLEAWRDTYATLHLWTQVVGKVKIALAPAVNHSWHSAFQVTSRGLTTSPMPFGARTFQVDFDFVDHQLIAADSEGVVRTLSLRPQTVADFYHGVMSILHEMKLDVKIWPRPVEIPEVIRFDEDRTHAAYDREYVERFRRILIGSDSVMKQFRGRYLGKCSPVHFFWGSFDLAVTRFSGRRAPVHPGGIPNLSDRVTREAYSHEVSSCGFWPGGGPVQEAAFYAYAYPEPPDFATAGGLPSGAYYHAGMHEFILPYDVVRKATDPEALILDFCQSTYEAAADAGGWDRANLER